MKKSDGEIHEKTASWGILQSEWLRKCGRRGRDIFVRHLIISSHNICTDYRNY